MQVSDLGGGSHEEKIFIGQLGKKSLVATTIDFSAYGTRALAYWVGGFLLDPHRQLLKDGVPVQIGRKSLNVLSVLAEAEGVLVTKDEMMAAVWPNVIVEENAIQAQIVALRKLLGADAGLLSTVRGLGYRLAASADQGIALAPQASIPRSPLPARRPVVQIILAAVPLAIVGATSLWPSLHQPAKIPAKPLTSPGSPASGANDDKFQILPLTIRSGGADTRSFATGLSDEIASVFSDVHIPVVPYTDNLKRGGAGEAGASPSPRADLLIDGTLQGDGKTFLVVARLDDMREHVTVWSATFRGAASSPEALQAKVAVHVANVAKWAEAGRSGRVKLDAASLGAFIAGRESTTGLSDNADGADLSYYQKVAAAAPDFSLGHSSLAFALADSAADQPAVLAARSRREAQREAHRALQLDPHNGEAYVALEMAMPVSDWAGREDLLLRGAAVDPGYEPVIMMEARLMWATGRGHKAIDWFERAQSLNPLHPGQTSALVMLLASEGIRGESRALLDRMEIQWPGLSWTEHVRFWQPLLEGLPDRTLAILTDRKTRPSDMSDATLKAWRTALEGIIAGNTARKLVAARATVGAVNAGQLFPGVGMLLLAQLGNLDAAFQVEKSYDIEDLSPQPFLFLTPTAQLRADPRFMGVAKRLGLVAYWRKTGYWPDYCSEPGLPYDCRAEAAKVGS